MLGRIKRFFSQLNRLALMLNPKLFTKELPGRTFWLSTRKGSAVKVHVPENNGETLGIFFQRQIKPSDVKDGKLLPVFRKVKRRGCRVQTGLQLSFETAETLHKLLGPALQDAREKQ